MHVIYPPRADTMERRTKHARHLENVIQRAAEREDESVNLAGLDDERGT